MPNDPSINVLGISGSLRKGSLNLKALKAAGGLLPAGCAFQIADISGVPVYDNDVYDKGFPPAVETLRAQVSAADALLIATPEYNYSIPGVLKNAIDWVSRPPDQPFAGKPVALLGASPGGSGTMRAQYHLRQVFVFLDMKPVNKPEVFIPGAAGKFDEAGALTDERTAESLAALGASLVDWTLRLKG
jgi:chromate reductase